MRTRTYEWDDPTVDYDRVMTMSGLDQLKALIAENRPPPISRTLDFLLTEVELGRVVFEGHPGEFLYNPIGSVHGGYAATLLDSALGCVVHSMLPPGMAYTTIELKVNYVRAIRADTGPVLAEGKIVHFGGRIATAEARLFGKNDGKMFAHGTTTCLVFPAAEAAKRG